MTEMLEKYEGDEEEATLAVLKKKEKQLEKLLFLDSPALQKIARRNRTGPLNAYFVRK